MPWTTETILATIGKAPASECVTDAHLATATKLTATQVKASCDRLRRYGFIKRSDKGCHTLTRAGREAVEQGINMRSGPKGKETGHRRCKRVQLQRAWNVLRMGKKVTNDDIVMRVVEGDEKDAYSNVRRYVRALALGGYVKEMPQREPAAAGSKSNGCKRWLLISDTGPEAPVWRVSRGVIYDPNLQAEIAMVREIDEVRA